MFVRFVRERLIEGGRDGYCLCVGEGMKGMKGMKGKEMEMENVRMFPAPPIPKLLRRSRGASWEGEVGLVVIMGGCFVLFGVGWGLVLYGRRAVMVYS